MHLLLLPLLCLLGSTVNAFYVGVRSSGKISLPTPGNEILDCSHGSAFLPSPYDCHSFYRCFSPNAVPVKMSCGFLMYNPLLNHCDWPSNTIRVREECGTSNGYFGSNSEAETREVEATTAKPKEVKTTTPKEPRIIAEPDFVAGAPVVFYVNKNKENKPPRLSQGKTKRDEDRIPSLFEIILDPEGELQEEEIDPLFDIVLRPEKFITQSAEEREAEEEEDLPNPSDFNQFRYEFTSSSTTTTTTTTQPSTTTTKPTTTSTTTTEPPPNFPMNDVEVFDRDNFTSTTTTTTTSTTNTPELLNQADRQMFLRKLELGLITTTTTQSTTTTPTTTTTSAKLTTTKSKTTKRPNYKYSRPTYFFSAPTFGPPCYCPCLTSASYGSQKYDPFEEQKLLFDLERARGYSTEDPLTTTQGMTEEEMTTIIPDTFRYIQEEGDSILEEQIEFTTTMTTPHGRSLNYTNLESQEEVSTYYPIQNEDEEPITDLPPLEPIKPRFFQAFEFVEIARKLGEDPEEEEGENTNEVEPSESITQCIGEFLGCLEKSGDKLSTRAKKCYQLFQDCSGSVILIPDV